MGLKRRPEVESGLTWMSSFELVVVPACFTQLKLSAAYLFGQHGEIGACMFIQS